MVARGVKGTTEVTLYREREGAVTHETQGGSRLDRVEESVARDIDRGTDTVGNSYEDLNGLKARIRKKSERRRRSIRKGPLGPVGNSRAVGT